MSHLISRQLTLTCLGPVHIGSGEQLSPQTQYIYDSDNRRAYFINEPAWIRLLAERRLLLPFIDFVKSPVRDKSLFQWCQKNGLQTRSFEQISTGWAHVPVQPDRDFSHLNKLALITRGADGRPYIPGSIIKGYLRTAILHGLITRLTPEQKRRYWQDFSQAVTRCRDKRALEQASNIIKTLEQDLLHKLKRTNERGQSLADTTNAVNSALQGLRVGDAYPQKLPLETHLVRKLDWQIISPDKNPEKYLPLSRECFAPDTKLIFSLTIEPAILAHIGIHSLDDILVAAAEFTQSVLTLKRIAFGSGLQNLFNTYTHSNLFLGGGSGLITKTLLYSLAPKDEARATTAAMLDILFSKFDPRARQTVPSHRHGALDKALSPRTLKLGRLQGNTCLMGACRLELPPC